MLIQSATRPADAPPGEQRLKAYALYYVCEGENGLCLYRRQDFEVPVFVGSGS